MECVDSNTRNQSGIISKFLIKVLIIPFNYLDNLE